MMYTCVHRLSTVHTVLPLCDSPHHPPKTHELSPRLSIIPEQMLYTPLLPHTHWLEGAAPNTQQYTVHLSPTL